MWILLTEETLSLMFSCFIASDVVSLKSECIYFFLCEYKECASVSVITQSPHIWHMRALCTLMLCLDFPLYIVCCSSPTRNVYKKVWHNARISPLQNYCRFFSPIGSFTHTATLSKIMHKTRQTWLAHPYAKNDGITAAHGFALKGRTRETIRWGMCCKARNTHPAKHV